MSGRKIEGLLLGLLGAWDADADEVHQLLEDVVDVKSFAEAGLMSNDRGVVLSLGDGSEFQLTIVQSSYVEAVDE